MAKTDAIILAAGLSRRMGDQNKLLLDWRGMPMVRHVVQTYIRAIGPNVTVVTGHESDAVQAALADLDVTFHFNPAFEQGQFTSVAAGLHLPSQAQNTLIGLGDQPFLTEVDIATLLIRHTAAPDRITIPVNGELRGNPIVVPASLRPRLLEDRARPGCKRFIQANPDLVHRVTLPASGFYTDIDTPDAYVQHEGGDPNEELV